MTSPLRRVLVRRPALTGDFTAAGWPEPDPTLLADQHDRFVRLLTDLGCAVDVAPAVDGLVDACYVRDPALVTGTGVVLFEMAKPVRGAEPDALRTWLDEHGIPVVGTLGGEARADGGDLVWLDEHTLLVGRSYRTNDEGVRQLRALLAPEGVTVEAVDVPHDQGPEHVLHLMSFLSPVAPDLAVMYLPLAPVRLVEMLRGRGVRIIAVDAGEYASMACNVLAARPYEVVLVEGNPRTEQALRDHGCTVHSYAGSEVSVKGSGGPTCLTLPLLRG